MIITPLVLTLCAAVPAETLTLPIDRRPAWLREEGIVMAGSWEALPFRAQRDCHADATPSPEQRAGYAREQSPQMLEQLKALGVNFIMTHAYKGLGVEAERESMQDAVRFAALCRQHGLRVGVYCNSGTLHWKTMFEERPDSPNWLLLNHLHLPIMYGYAPYRFRWDRNHPDAAKYHRDIVDFSIREIQADLLHFDNYNHGPGTELNAQRRFREYLDRIFTAEQLQQMGIRGPGPVRLPLGREADPMLHRAWALFASDSLAETYYELTRHARAQRPDVLLELNPGGPGERIRPPVDHGRMLRGGEAFWDEGRPPGFQGQTLHTRIRTYKVARAMNNIAFAYATNPLEAAESMAFNDNCLGCICWFEFGEIVEMPGSTAPVSPKLSPYVRFFRERRDLYNHTRVIADVAVLRSFASQVFSDPSNAALTARVEQELIEQRVPFQIIYDQQLPDLGRYRVLVLAGCVALSDAQIRTITQFVEGGGHLLMVGPAGTHDEWMRPRERSPLEGIDSPHSLRIAPDVGVTATLRDRWAEQLSARVEAPRGVCAEYLEQSRRRLVHLVNYADQGVQEIRVEMRVPAGVRVRGVTVTSPENGDPHDLKFTTAGDRVSFTVPAIGVYAVAAIELTPRP